MKQAPASVMRTLRLPILVCCALGVVACAGSSDRPPACPRAAVLNDAATMTRFAPGGGRDPLDIDFDVEIADLASGCQFEKKGKNFDRLVVAVAPVFVTTRGPANASRKVEYVYFVSLIGPDGDILSRQSFPVAVAFSGNQRQLTQRDDDPPVTIDIPLTRAEDAVNYEVLLGLQLTEDELQYNRQRIGARR
jgi:hypothetical protein